MDSMRHLSTSLPGPRRRQDHSELLTDFKAAALSVTNLYKSAAAAQVKVRNAGYQDALDDLLAFLDKENLGLMDGEGWTVRQWATERLVDDTGTKQPSDDEGENATESGEKARSLSPEVQRKPSNIQTSSAEPEESSAGRTAHSEPPQQPLSVPTQDDFSFRSQHPYPSGHQRESSNSQGMDLDASTPNAISSTTAAQDNVRLIQRSSRGRHNNYNRRGNPSAINLSLSGGAGTKRKLPFPDFFDISGLNYDGQDRKDGGPRGGKRGRPV